MAPDERALRADIERPAFRAAALDRWRVLKVVWPYAFVAVKAKDGHEFTLRLDCAGFPQAPPTGGPWDMQRDAVLAPNLWPRSNGGRLGAVFNPGWKGGTALYLPCDRESIAGHDAWRTQMPSKIWRPSDGLVQYLELVHELLHSKDYSPPARAAA